MDSYFERKSSVVDTSFTCLLYFLPLPVTFLDWVGSAWQVQNLGDPFRLSEHQPVSPGPVTMATDPDACYLDLR